MRSISTDYLEQANGLDPSPVRMTGALRDGYRPRAATIERSREIREAAARLIAEQGLWRFSMLALARRLNCLLPTLCYYYKKREELIADIVLRHVETLRTRTAVAMDEAEDTSPAGEIHAFAREYLLAAIAERDFHRLMVHYAHVAGPEDGAAFAARAEALLDLVETRLTLHAPALGGRRETARALSRAMLDTISGAAAWMEPYGVVRPAAYAAMVAGWVLDQAARG